MKHVIVVLAIAIVGVLGHPRALLARQVSGGFKAGISAARVAGLADAIGEPVEEKYRWGTMAGGFVTVDIDDVFAFQPEVLYAMKGEKVEGNPGGVSTEFTFDVRYVEAPLLVRINVPAQAAYFLAGPAIGFRVSAESRAVGGGTTFTEDVTNQARSVDIGLAFGAGAKFGRFFVEGRWTEGLRDAATDDRFDNKVRNRALALLAGVHF